MTKSKSGRKSKRKEKKSIHHSRTVAKPPPPHLPSTPSPLDQATEFLQTSRPHEALQLAEHALTLSKSASSTPKASLPALTLLGDICVELGDIEKARDYYSRAVDLDPDGLVPADAGGGPEKFLWLAQLCDEGGDGSVRWFERGISVLRRQITELEIKTADAPSSDLGEKKDQLAKALCGIAEVYMTDLSWEDEAENRCEAAVTEAIIVSPGSPEPLQTLASVRISQLRLDEARAALTQSMARWKDLPPDDAKVPGYPARISLARLLLETEMEEEALEVLDRLVREDDQSVEAWYLGGWTLYIKGEKAKERNGQAPGERAATRSVTEWESTCKSSQNWLENCLRLYQLLDYEDERLKEHAIELVGNLYRSLGDAAKEESDEEDEEDVNEDAWEDHSDEADSTDTRMKDA